MISRTLKITPGAPVPNAVARFDIGQIVHHRLFNYRGVIVDIDPIFLGTDEWYEEVAVTRPPKDEPWYHVLVDNESYETYVAERNLVGDMSRDTVTHPLLDAYFDAFENGHYSSSQRRPN